MDLLLSNKTFDHVVDKLFGDLPIIHPDSIVRIFDNDTLGVDRIRDSLDNVIAGNRLFKRQSCDDLLALLELQLGILVIRRKPDDDLKVLGGFLVPGKSILAYTTTVVSLGILWIDLYRLVAIPIKSVRETVLKQV